ncbi:hypothetical protein ACTXT7_006976 [Hymenolepis weldensis]
MYLNHSKYLHADTDTFQRLLSEDIRSWKPQLRPTFSSQDGLAPPPNLLSKSRVMNSKPINALPVTKMIDYTGYIHHCWSNGSRMLILGLAADTFD